MKRAIVLFLTFSCITFFASTLFGAEEVAEVSGFADIHLHQMAEFAFAGAWLHGNHNGTENEALKKCSGGDIFGGDHARTALGPINELLGQVPGTDGDTGWHFGKKYGYPEYTGWPRWDTIAHQQVWEGHLKKAHEDGLNVYFMSAVNFRELSELMPKKNRKYPCNEMESVKLQLQAAIDFADSRDWVEIAKSPEEARSIINSGKLAIILSIECSELFDDDNWEERLNFYYHQYHVRSIQLGHQKDNRFTGVAPHHFIFKIFQAMEDLKNIEYPVGFELDENGKNVKGLTDEGKLLAKAMIEKKMLMDISHLSERSVDDIYEISKEHDYYPLILSHGHLRSIMMDKKQKEEKTTPDSVIEIIRETGGIIGLRTGPEEVKTYTKSGVPNDCDGSAKSFAQAYQYADKGLKVNTAFGSDFNGFIQQLRPRFGNKNETCAASDNIATRDAQREKQTGKTGTQLDTQGFGHIGIEGDIIRELKNFGVDTANLENSAETLIQVWERCFDKNRTALDTSDMDTSGIE